MFDMVRSLDRSHLFNFRGRIYHKLMPSQRHKLLLIQRLILKLKHSQMLKLIHILSLRIYKYYIIIYIYYTL